MKKLTGVSLFIFFAVVTAILTAGLVFYQNSKNTSVDTGVVSNNTKIVLDNLTSSGVTTLDSKEVSKHNTNADCWMIINNKIYNLSDYASSHPGGIRSVLNYCGKEATQAFDTKGGRGNSHSTSANKMLDQYFIGNLNQNINQNTLSQTVQKTQVVSPSLDKGNEFKND